MATTSTTTTTKTKEGDYQHDVDLAAMKKLMLDAKVDGTNKSVWTTTLETFGMADGKTKKNDIIVDTMEDGVVLLRDYVKNIEQVLSDSQKKKRIPTICWDLVPLSEFSASKEDFFLAFLSWAEKETGDTSTTIINVSKARRRMEAYFEWMNDNRKDLEEPPTVQSILPAAKVWDIQITYDDKGQYVWWLDLGSLNHQSIQSLDNKDHLRYVVWFSHLVMFDKRARTNGAMIIEDMGHMGFWKLATMFPHDLSTKMDRLTIGILPVKMKAIYVFGAATWMTLLMGLMKPFMEKKMRERMVLLSGKTDMQAFCDDLVSRKNIPKGFCSIEGEAKRDAVLESFANKDWD